MADATTCPDCGGVLASRGGCWTCLCCDYSMPGSCLPVTQSCTCAVCGHSVGLDTDHVEIDAETVWMDDRNDQRSYVLHLGCADSTIGAWEEPA